MSNINAPAAAMPSGQRVRLSGEGCKVWRLRRSPNSGAASGLESARSAEFVLIVASIPP
jgi:hypothetical protein